MYSFPVLVELFFIVRFVLVILIVTKSLPRIVVLDIHTQEDVDATIAFSEVISEFWLQIFHQIK